MTNFAFRSSILVVIWTYTFIIHLHAWSIGLYAIDSISKESESPSVTV